MAALLRDRKTINYDVLAIQEPWRNPFMNTTHHPIPQHFELAYYDHKETRVCFFINKRIEARRWSVTHHTPDLSTLQLRWGEEENEEIVIHNVYNPVPSLEPANSTLPVLRTAMERWRHADQIVVGDFNLHHPYWGGVMAQRADPEAEETLRLIEDYDLGLLYETGTVTFRARDSESTIDLSLATPRLQDSLIRCLPQHDLDHDSDHIPLETVLAKPTRGRTFPEKWNWELTDQERLHRVLIQNLPELTTLITEHDIDNATQAIVSAILIAVNESTPKTRASPRSIPGWTKECKEAQQLARRLRRRYQRERTPEAWEAYRRARNHKARLIRKALRDYHRKRVKEATGSLDSLWKITRWARSREPRTTLIPPLQRPDGGLETDATNKLEMFKQAFFPPPPDVDLTDIEGYEYPHPIQLPPITLREVTEAIRRMPGKKAPGKDTIPSHLLHRISLYIAKPLQDLYNACLRLHYCPQHFRKSVTVTLRKPGKSDYGQLKAYRPVALLNTLGKVMESILAKRLSYVVEKHNLLPEQHMGGRRGVSTELAVHVLLERIHTTWKLTPSHVASVLFLDVSGAFDHVSHTRLLHNLRKRRIDRDTVAWIASFLGNRTTTIRMGDIESEPYTVAVGIPQGSPLSPILYLFYNADLLEAAADSDIRTSGWIDDIYFFTRSTSTEQNCRNLERAHRRAEEWARTHGSRFSPAKYQLMHFTRARTKFNVTQTMTVAGAEIKPAKTATYLGIRLTLRSDGRTRSSRSKGKQRPFSNPSTR
jgi:hypothetical protein